MQKRFKVYTFLIIASMIIGNMKTIVAQSNMEASNIKKEVVDATIQKLKEGSSPSSFERIERGVAQAASLWRESDGSADAFSAFCQKSFIKNDSVLEATFLRVSYYFEALWGNMNRLTIDLKRPLHLNMGPLMPIDDLFGSYDASSHINDDFYDNKIAFTIILNYPAYSLQEKMQRGNSWNSMQWAYARLGDVFISRVPAELIQKNSEVTTAADTYISDYNIYMGNLLDASGKTLFPMDRVLITHWGLRDELKSQYADKKEGVAKQKMIYEVMSKIISQEIPEKVINNKDLQWNPYTNEVLQKGKKIQATPEPDTRYQHLLNVFNAIRATDKYSPQYPTYLQRTFEENMEIPQEQVEKLFVDFVSSPTVQEVAKLIESRLGRKLQPFDIWYDGFKDRSSISETELDKQTKSKYPNTAAFEADLPNLLVKLGFTPERAKEITSHIAVDASRGAGHAWRAEMRSDVAHLRTRIGASGMNYKGYNIAVHEFGHNVEQTITLHNVDYYMMKGIPNTAFTEALAFVFQKRDLELLGIKSNDPNKEHMAALDNFWACYEIMGVSLVDMNVWKWLYQNPNADAKQLREAVIRISKEVWNQYYAPVFGVKDQTVLAIYSHMISTPLYLSAYPVGRIIQFQIEKQIEGKNFAAEVERMFSKGKLVPQIWMKQAVGRELSVDPILEATKQALKVIR